MIGPIDRSRRWMVIRRRPGAAARYNHPTKLADALGQASLVLYDDERVGVYELVPVESRAALAAHEQAKPCS